jgi:periplasmic protein CpxP/Spy
MSVNYFIFPRGTQHSISFLAKKFQGKIKPFSIKYIKHTNSAAKQILTIKIKLKNMKRLIVLAAATLIAIGGYAQGKRQPKTATERAEKVTNKMKEKLNLTDDQVQKIKAINLEAAQQKDSLKSDKAELKNKVKTIETSRDAKIKEVLTDAQKAEYEKMKANAAQKMDKKREKRKGKQTPNTNDTESED